MRVSGASKRHQGEITVTLLLERYTKTRSATRRSGASEKSGDAMSRLSSGPVTVRSTRLDPSLKAAKLPRPHSHTANTSYMVSLLYCWWKKKTMFRGVLCIHMNEADMNMIHACLQINLLLYLQWKPRLLHDVSSAGLRLNSVARRRQKRGRLFPAIEISFALRYFRVRNSFYFRGSILFKQTKRATGPAASISLITTFYNDGSGGISS